MLLYDQDIRSGLKNVLSEEYSGTNTIIIDELPICWGDTRIDIAVVNGSLHGYEIKSDRDTLDRLPRQIESYNKIFDTVTLVCSARLVEKAKNMIPDWWGIQIPISDNSTELGVSFKIERDPQVNDHVDLRSLVELTWKNEAISILAEYGFARGFRSRPKWDIWDRMVEVIDPEILKEEVRNCLKERQDWRKPETLQRLSVD